VIGDVENLTLDYGTRTVTRDESGVIHARYDADSELLLRVLNARADHDETARNVLDVVTSLGEMGVTTTIENGHLKFDYSNVGENISETPEWVNYADF